jgi:hypothetical protein
MRCIRCNSRRLVRFIDGFGERRIFCRDCWGSFTEEAIVELGAQKRLTEFKEIFYNNNKAIARW